ncbi:HNH endonuclease [Demequina flava]|uniref:HNH endonuclease n=1 Tax=Demequina flava TaxID=1095025 RepID=UPI00078342FE|nr:HNH endonuclease signature motif containing protein [Demequina flava]
MASDVAEIDRVIALVSAVIDGDASALSRDELRDGQASAARLERVAGALNSWFAGEISRRSAPGSPDGGFARREGFGDAGKMIAKRSGGTAGRAKRTIQAGDAFTPVAPVAESPGLLGGGEPADAERDAARPRAARSVKYPRVAQAQVSGELSVEAAGTVVQALNEAAQDLDPQAVAELEARLVGKAVGLSAHEVQKMVATALARANREGRQRREREQYDERYVAWKQDHRGMVRFHGQMDAVTAAPIINAIEQMVTQDFRARRDSDPAEADQRTVGQMRADALHTLARHAAGCQQMDRSGVRTSIVVRMNVSDIEGDDGIGTIDGIDAPVSVGQLRRLAGDAGIIPEVLGKDGEVLDLGRHVRVFSRAQRLALLERDGGCAKCHAPPEHCEAHHITWWSRGGLSNLDNGVMLCTRCHHDIHRYGWDIVATATSVSFIPPTQIDPRRRPIAGGVRAIDIREPDPGIPPDPPPRDSIHTARHQRSRGDERRDVAVRAQRSLCAYSSMFSTSSELEFSAP